MLKKSCLALFEASIKTEKNAPFRVKLIIMAKTICQIPHTKENRSGNKW